MIKVNFDPSFMSVHTVGVISLSLSLIRKNIMLMSPWYHLLEGGEEMYIIMEMFKTKPLALCWVKSILQGERDDIAVALIHI